MTYPRPSTPEDAKPVTTLGFGRVDIPQKGLSPLIPSNYLIPAQILPGLRMDSLYKLSKGSMHHSYIYRPCYETGERDGPLISCFYKGCAIRRVAKGFHQRSQSSRGEQKDKGSGRISSVALRETEIPTNEVHKDVRNLF